MPESTPKRPMADLAEYALEFPLACPHCRQEVSVVHVVRLLRTKVSFVSTLPRRGHAVICPECSGLLSVELGGMA